MTRLPIRLDNETVAALIKLAHREFRDPRAQAALIIQQELVRLGLLSHENKDNDEGLPIDYKQILNDSSNDDITTGEFDTPTCNDSATQK